jgi:hypothetical protein
MNTFDIRDYVDFSELNYARKHKRDLGERPHVVTAYSWGVDEDGNLLWVDQPQLNILHDEGEQAILSAYFDTDLAGFGAPPASLYMGLDNRTALAENDTLSMGTFNELSGGGYARQAISTSTGFTLSQPGAYYQATQVANSSFGPATSGGMGTAKYRFLCTVSTGTSGKLIASLALSTTRTINQGDTLNTNLIIGLSE